MAIKTKMTAEEKAEAIAERKNKIHALKDEIREIKATPATEKKKNGKPEA